MLYENHCRECHDREVHWRANSLVSDCESLLAQINHWQRALNLDWKKPEIDQVSRYLNDRYYY